MCTAEEWPSGRRTDGGSTSHDVHSGRQSLSSYSYSYSHSHSYLCPYPSSPPRSRRSASFTSFLSIAIIKWMVLAMILAAASMRMPTAEATFSMKVESGSEECFVVRATGASGTIFTINGNFDCLDDGISPDPVSVTLYDPRMRPVWKSPPSASEGMFSVIGQGRYQLCIGNGAKPSEPDGTDRTIGFAVRVRDLQKERERKRREAMEGAAEDGNGGGDGDEKDEGKSKSVAKAGEMATLTEQLMERLMAMKDHQSFLREREAMHRDVAESTFGLIIRWTFVEAGALVLVAAGQIFYLRKFFETRRYL